MVSHNYPSLGICLDPPADTRLMVIPSTKYNVYFASVLFHDIAKMPIFHFPIT